MPRWFGTLALVVAVASCGSPGPPGDTWPALDEQFIADAAATYNFRLGEPVVLAIARDGGVLFRRTPPREFSSDLYELTPEGETRTLATVAEMLGDVEENLSDAEKARRERTRTATKGVVDVGLSDDGNVVMMPLGGVFHLIERKTGRRSVVDPQGAAYDPQLAPDGHAIAFVRDGDLWIVGPGHAPRRLTQHPAEIEYGVAEFVAQEEFDRRRGYWWSPDSRAIVFQRSDAREVETLHVSDPRHPERRSVPFKYPRPGTPNAVVDLGIVGVDGGAPRWIRWDLERYMYLIRVDWPRNGPLTALVLNRDQTDAALLAIDPVRGTMRPLVVEHDDAWINVDAGAPQWLEDGSGFLWMSEAKGAWVLELRAADGTLVRELTAPEFGLRRLSGVDGDRRAAIVTAHADAPYQDVYRIPLDGAPVERLSEGSGVSSAYSRHGITVVGTQHAAGGRTTTVVSPAGTRNLEAVAEQPALVPTTVLETVEVDGRTHHVAITRPRDFDQRKRYPVILKAYAGPSGVMVLASRDSYVMDQWCADAGFIVVRSDNRGTPNRGRAWERAFLRDLISVAIDDQAGALAAVGARHPDLDLSRVGVVGWSFGGYFATMAVLLRPDVFHAAIAGAPVTDWALYDTGYTERYMKTPQQNPEGYAATSALTHAAKLERPLLILHGITDDNVHFAHSLALIEALYLSGKRAEVIPLSATHMVPDPKLSLARERVQIDFFREHLGLR